MAIAVVSSDYATGHSVTSVTKSFTVSSGSDRMLFVSVRCSNDANYPTGVTFNGDSLTSAWAYTSYGGQYTGWYIVAPDVATGNVVVTWAASKNNIIVSIVSLTGVAQTSSVGTPANNASYSSSGSLSLSSASGELCLAGLVSSSDDWTEDGSQTLINEPTNNSAIISFCSKAGESTTAFAWTKDSGSAWYLTAGIPIKPAAAATDYDLATASGAVTTNGTATGLLADRKLPSASGAVTTDGTATGLTSTRLLGVSAGAVTTDGTAVVFPLTRKLETASGEVTTAGTAIGIFRGKGIVTASGGVVVAGTDVAFPITRTIAVGSGGVVVAGTDVTLSALTDYLLEIAAGSVTTDGTAVALEAARLLATASGAVTTAGTDIDFSLWYLVLIGEYPDLVTAARHATYSVAQLSDRVNFNVEVTGGDYLVTRDVDLLSGVVAGQDKTATLNALVCPFFDASFAVDGDLISAVNYKIDAGAKTAIPAAYGTDLADRVRSFSLSFDSSGDKRLTLYVTDDDSNEYSDELIVRVSA